jgi:galactokinase
MPSFSNLKQGLADGVYNGQLETLYSGNIDSHKKRLLNICDIYAGLFDTSADVSVFSAPGRSEVCGNHTDHNKGKVLAAAVNLDVLAVAAKTDSPRISVKSVGHEKDDIDLSVLTPMPYETGHSAALIRGVAAGFVKRGYRIGGFNAATASDVLSGSGLSSSAAFEALIGTILNVYYNNSTIPAIEIAKISQEAENRFFGKPCGLMDQTACSVGGFVSIDFADTDNPIVEKISFDFAATGYALVITNSGGSHADLTSEYTAVRAEMEAVAHELGKAVLRETSREALVENLPGIRRACGDRAVLRALHFFAENARVDQAKAALQTGDFQAFLSLIRQSGQSSFNYNQNVYTNKLLISQPVSLALALSEGVLGGAPPAGAWRVHGGGFAGTIQAFVPLTKLESYKQVMSAAFGPKACFVLNVRERGGVALV